MKFGRILLTVFLLNAFLVSTHRGEFWPFSIYPMFSQAGNPWTRSMVVDVSDLPDSLIWASRDYPDLPGEVVSTFSLDIDQIDYSNFVFKTKVWDEDRVDALRFMIGEENVQDRKLLIVKISGALNSSKGVESKVQPFLLFTNQGNFYNPLLKKTEYSQHESN